MTVPEPRFAVAQTNFCSGCRGTWRSGPRPPRSPPIPTRTRYCNTPPNHVRQRHRRRHRRPGQGDPRPAARPPRASPDGSPTPGALTRPYVPRLLPTTLGVERPREGLTTVLSPESPFIDLPTSEHSGRKQLTPAIAGTTNHPHTAPAPSLDRRVARLVVPRAKCAPLRQNRDRPGRRGRTQMASTAQRVFPGEGSAETPTAARQPAFDQCQPPGAGGCGTVRGLSLQLERSFSAPSCGDGKQPCYNR